MNYVRKRDGRLEDYDRNRIVMAIRKAGVATGELSAAKFIELAKEVEGLLYSKEGNEAIVPNVEYIQDLVIQTLRKNKFDTTAAKYETYRNERTRERAKHSSLMSDLKELTLDTRNNQRRENANIDSNTSMGMMLKYGTTTAKAFNDLFVLEPEHAAAHKKGDIHIHDLDFYTLTTTCCQIDITKLFEGGFSTGHGFLRPPSGIASYSALACIAIQSNQNDQHGGQSIPTFDFAMADGVRKTFRKSLKTNVERAIDYLKLGVEDVEKFNLHSSRGFSLLDKALESEGPPSYKSNIWVSVISGFFPECGSHEARLKAIDYAWQCAEKDTERATYQAMEALIHNLNTMNSRAGAQVPFSSINYGTDTSEEGRLVMKSLLEATEAGLGNGETPIFPIQIFKVKDGISGNPEDKNYDLFKLACRVSAKRLFPNFSFIDAPFNLQYYKKGKPETEVAYMGALHDKEHLYVKIGDRVFDCSIGDLFHFIKTGIQVRFRPCQLYSNTDGILYKAPVVKNYSSDSGKIDCTNTVCGVYAITHLPSDTTYIGSSGNIRQRWAEHRKHIVHKGCPETTVLFCDGNLDNYEFKILEESTEYKEAEKRWIETIPNVNVRGTGQSYYKTPRVTHYKRKDKIDWVRDGFSAKADWVNLESTDIKVLDIDGSWTKVLNIHKNSEKNTRPMIFIHYMHGDKKYELMCTEEHPIYQDGDFKEASLLSIGDFLEDRDGCKHEIIDIGYIQKPVVSFDIETATGTFVGSDIKMHNCRTRVMGNVYDKHNEIATGRGNLSFTSINLPRLAIKADKDIEKFRELLKTEVDIVIEQLLHRFEIQCCKTVGNFPFLMGQGVWLGSDRLAKEDVIAEVLKHGSLSVGFIGLAETLTCLIGKHHGESEEAQKLGLAIISDMRKYLDAKSTADKLNFTLLATPAEGLSGRFVEIDRKIYGSIPGVTDKEYYTNSFHIPVGFEISAYDKIQLEAPYHEYCNAGCITYVEMDGDPTSNLEAFEQVVMCMKESGVGYGAVNHPVDRDPVCGYTGVIEDVCPSCGRTEEEHKPGFEHIRRVTGYLAGTVDRFNNAKQAEVRDRTKHA